MKRYFVLIKQNQLCVLVLQFVHSHQVIGACMYKILKFLKKFQDHCHTILSDLNGLMGHEKAFHLYVLFLLIIFT